MDPIEGQTEGQGPIHEIARASIPLSLDLTEFEAQKRALSEFADELARKMSGAFDPDRILSPLETRLEAIERRIEAAADRLPRPGEQADPEAPRVRATPEGEIERPFPLPSREQFDRAVGLDQTQQTLDDIKEEVERIHLAVLALSGGGG